MFDQADQLRKLVRDTVSERPSLEPGVPLIVLSGGKGGVGTSTVAIHLSRELARLGKRTVLVDANPLQPDIATQLNVNSEVSLIDILNGSRSAVEVLKPLGESVQLLPGRWAPETPPAMGREAVKRVLAELRSLHAHADMVILDAGCGMSPWVEQLWKAAHQVLLMTTLDSVALMDSYATVKLAPWGDVDSKVRLVVNKCNESRLALQAGDRFAVTCRRFLGVNVSQPPAVLLQASSDSLAQGHSSSASNKKNNASFYQSIRLLSAEVLSSCLVLSGRTKLPETGIAKKSLHSPNQAQPELRIRR